MNPAIGNFVRIVLYQLLFGVEVQNVFYFEVTDVVNTPTWSVVVQTLMQDFVDELNELQVDDVSNDKAQYDVMTALGAFGEVSLNGGGNRVSDCFAPFATYPVQLVRNSKATRNGRKAFCGVSEDIVTNGVFDFDSTWDSYIAAVTTWLSSPQTVTVGSDEATLVQRIASLVGSVDGRPTTYNGITNAVMGNAPSTQNSRKFGRGV